MKIFFDFELTDTPLPLTNNSRILLKETKDFVEQRKILKDEIKAYEDGFIVINILGTLDKYPLGILPFGYSDE